MKRFSSKAKVAATLAATALTAGTIGYASYYLAVVKPEQDAEAFSKASVAACNVFQTSLWNAAQESDLKTAYADIFAGAKSALEEYKKAGITTEKMLDEGPADFQRLSKIETLLDGLGSEAYATVSEQVQVLRAVCEQLEGQTH